MSATITRRFHLRTAAGRRHGYRRQVVAGAEPEPAPEPVAPKEERVHALALRMALAIECKRLIDSGVVTDAAEMSRVAGVTRARMTQILNLTLLAPDLQELLLHLSPADRISREELSAATAHVLWAEQRRALA